VLLVPLLLMSKSEWFRPAARIAVVATLTAAAVLQASTPRFFTAAAQTDFLQGDIENLSIDSRGQLMLGPATTTVYEASSPFVWALTPGTDGSLFLGTGNDGRVLRVDAQGRAAPFFDAAELEIHALAAAPNGGLYAASSPDGKIYRLDRNGTPTTLFDPEDKYIWALATDSRGNVYAGTGEKGVVYKITPDGTGTPFYRTKATHATVLAFDPAGNLLVGTGSPGRVFRVDAEGRGFLLLDTPFDEIRALRFDARGALYVAAVNARAGGSSAAAPSSPEPSGSGTSSGPARSGTPTVTVEVVSVSTSDSSSGGGSSSSSDDRSSGGADRGALYRVAPDGLWDLIWSSRDDLPYDVVTDSEGRLIVATGNKGKIFRLEGDPLKPTLLARASAQQVTTLYRDARGALYYATANPGKLFRLSSESAAQGTYTSDVQDAKTVASWGVIGWRGTVPGGSRIEVSTRSGNSATPDDTWSPWSSAYAAPDSPVTSPKARYLQWRAVLSGRTGGPILTSVSAAYVQRNARPRVQSITVHPPGTVFQKPFPSGDPDLAGFEDQTTPDRKKSSDLSNSSGSSLGRKVYEKGLQTLAWKADDENGDELSYDLDYRREGDPAWKPLRRAMSEAIYVWDTTSVANGTYFVRVRASDAPSNGADASLVGELDSMALEIDNTAPAISAPSIRVDGNRTIVTFDATDDHSPIQKAESSSDGRTWALVFPRDGIADSKTERYEVIVQGPIGPRGLSLRVTDAMNNVATTLVEAPGAR